MPVIIQIYDTHILGSHCFVEKGTMNDVNKLLALCILAACHFCAPFNPIDDHTQFVSSRSAMDLFIIKFLGCKNMLYTKANYTQCNFEITAKIDFDNAFYARIKKDNNASALIQRISAYDDHGDLIKYTAFYPFDQIPRKGNKYIASINFLSGEQKVKRVAVEDPDYITWY